YPVMRLIRTRLGPYELGDLASGAFKQVNSPDNS
ncbi:MAG: hypothetical protein ACD_27C00036G0002, partial [uncultured bacterium]